MNTQQPNFVDKAAELLGGLTGLAAACGVTPQAVHKWIAKKAPAGRCLQIEKATSGKVTRYQLRPDVFGKKSS